MQEKQYENAYNILQNVETNDLDSDTHRTIMWYKVNALLFLDQPEKALEIVPSIACSLLPCLFNTVSPLKCSNILVRK